MPATHRDAPQETAEPRLPDRAALHEAALKHLARYAATRAGLLRVLERRIDRWARAATDDAEMIAALAQTSRQEAQAVVAALAQSGVLDDNAFASMRAQSLARAGRSRRAIEAHLRARGIAADLVSAAVPEQDDAEFAAALILARKRRIGGFRHDITDDPIKRRKEFAAMARAGFSSAVARRALATAKDEAEAIILRFRNG